MKSVKTLALVIGLIGLSGVAQAQFSSTWTAVSDYDFRGSSQSAKDPALQASADYAFGDSGWAIGAWASNVDFDDDADIELDLYAGYSAEINDTFSWNAGVTYYTYPSSDLDETIEFYAGFDAGVVGLGEQFLGDEVAADAAGHDAGAVPLAQRFLGGLDAARGHDLGPRHGAEHVLDELRAAHRTTGKYLDDLAAEFVRVRDLAGRAAAGRVGDAAPVADLGDVGVENGADHEPGAVGDVDARGGRVDDRAHAHDHRRVRLGEMPRHLEEHVRGEIAAVGELDALGAAVGAGLDDLLTDLGVRMIENRDHSLFHHRGQHTHPILVHQSLRGFGEFAGAFSRSVRDVAMRGIGNA